MGAYKQKTKKCRCGKRIALVDGQWNHVWWKRVDGVFVIHGSPYCVWIGQPPVTLEVASPLEEVSSLLG